jgi:hypothetical protein
MNKNLKAKNVTSSKNSRKPSVKVITKTFDRDSSKALRKGTPPSGQVLRTSAKDSPVNIESIDLSSEQDFDALQIAQATSSLKLQLLQSLQVFKTANNDYMSQNWELRSEVDTFQKDFMTVKVEVDGLLWESAKSKEGLSRMKGIIETPKTRTQGPEILDIDLSSVKENDEETLLNALKKLQIQVEGIREKIESNESQLKTKESENSELRSAVFKLRDSILATPDLVGDTAKNSCCGVF